MSPGVSGRGTVIVVKAGLIAEGRLHMEPVESGGGDIPLWFKSRTSPPPGAPD